MSPFTYPTQRVQISYKKSEVKPFKEMEEYLMDNLCIGSRSELHKYAIKHLHKVRQSLTLGIL